MRTELQIYVKQKTDEILNLNNQVRRPADHDTWAWVCGRVASGTHNHGRALYTPDRVLTRAPDTRLLPCLPMPAGGQAEDGAGGLRGGGHGAGGQKGLELAGEAPGDTAGAFSVGCAGRSAGASAHIAVEQ